MFIEAYRDNDLNLWYSNGGSSTDRQLVEKGQDYIDMAYRYIDALPYIKVVDNFILAHSSITFPDGYENMNIDEIVKLQSEDNILWDRSNIGQEKIYKNYKIIHGHTPVQTFSGDNKIVRLKNTFYIDCGCCFKDADGKLSCLRLDDMKEFYV